MNTVFTQQKKSLLIAFLVICAQSNVVIASDKRDSFFEKVMVGVCVSASVMVINKLVNDWFPSSSVKQDIEIKKQHTVAYEDAVRQSEKDRRNTLLKTSLILAEFYNKELALHCSENNQDTFCTKLRYDKDTNLQILSNLQQLNAKEFSASNKNQYEK